MLNMGAVWCKKVVNEMKGNTNVNRLCQIMRDGHGADGSFSACTAVRKISEGCT